jgi:hypothetical protein
LAFNVDSLECSHLCSLKDQSSFTGREANGTVWFALDEVCATMVADELDAVARPSIGIFVFALVGKPINNRVKANLRLVPVEFGVSLRLRTTRLK